MIKAHYPELFDDDPNWRAKADALAAKTYELTSFLVDVLGVTKVDAAFDGAVTYHDSCSGLRELGVRTQPRKLLASVEGLTLVEMKDSDVCCGFGGTFAVKYSDISGAIVDAKAKNVEAARRPDPARGRSRLPHEHGRQAQPRRQARSGAPRGRGAGRHDRRSADRRAKAEAVK